MSQEKSLDLLHRLAEEELHRELRSTCVVRLPDGTEKIAHALSKDDLASLEPSMKQVFDRWLHRNEMAGRGYMDMGDGEFKHIDHLTLEDVPRLRPEYGERLKQRETALKLLDFIARGVRDLHEMGLEVNWEDNETLKIWIRNDRA